MSLNELARKHRKAAGRDKKRGLGQAGPIANDNQKRVANGNKSKSQDEAGDDCQESHGAGGYFPRSPSKEREFVLTGSVTDGTNTDKDAENVPPSQYTDKQIGGVAIGQPQQPQLSHPNHKIGRKKLRWKEESNEGESCDLDDVFTANEQGLDKGLSAIRTHGFGGCDIKSSDLTTIATCDHMGDYAELVTIHNTKEQKDRRDFTRNGNGNSIMDDPRRQISDLRRKVPKLQR